MARGAGRGPFALLVPAVVLAILFLVARNFWVLGYFPSPVRPPVPAAGERITGTPPQAVEECPDCHQAVADLHRRGAHSPLACEDCHGAVEGHLGDGGEGVPMLRSKSIARLCSTCHREMSGGSERVPRLHLEAHVVETGALFSARICLDCHRPHDPRP